MYGRLLNFLEEHKILTNNRFEFRKLRSSYMALMVIINELTTTSEDEDHVEIFLNLFKAIDTVDNILQKLYLCGIRNRVLNWFESYLDNRRQFVTYTRYQSITKTITCGVPQGSILGCRLFFINIDDSCHMCDKSIPILFADDKNLFVNDLRNLSLKMASMKNCKESLYG